MFEVVTVKHPGTGIIAESKKDLDLTVGPQDDSVFLGNTVLLVKKRRRSCAISAQDTVKFVMDVYGMPPSPGTVPETPDFGPIKGRRRHRLVQIGELTVDGKCPVVTIEFEVPHHGSRQLLGTDFVEGAKNDSGLSHIKTRILRCCADAEFEQACTRCLELGLFKRPSRSAPIVLHEPIFDV